MKRTFELNCWKAGDEPVLTCGPEVQWFYILQIVPCVDWHDKTWVKFWQEKPFDFAVTTKTGGAQRARLRFATSPQEAPILHFDGPRRFVLSDKLGQPRFRPGESCDLAVVLHTQGLNGKVRTESEECSRKCPPSGGNRILDGPAGRRSDPGARGAEGAVLRFHLPWPRAGPLWSGLRKGPNHAVLPGFGGLECPPDNAGGPCRGRTAVGVGVALRPVGLGRGIRGGHGVVRDPEKGQTGPNQPLYLTGAALRRFGVQRLTSGPGRRTLPFRRVRLRSDRPKQLRINRLRCRRTDARYLWGVRSGETAPKVGLDDLVCQDRTGQPASANTWYAQAGDKRPRPSARAARRGW